KYVFLNQRISTGLVQTLGYLDDAWYQGNPILVVAEKYGKELTSGYHVYLTIGKNARIEQTSRGEAFVADQIPRDRDYVGLIGQNIDAALKTLEGLRPQYGN
ncbi:hypothetical protein U5B43_10400, partial [Campylobacter sp. 9BO]|uniref:hypothetical protein n=1 Tax=Campylobacter sp. 9BO TaxID=3424759 RepID=UPI003D336A76